MLDQLIAERWVTPKATVGLWRCKREGDDILVLAGNDWTRVPFLRQQVKKREGRANMWLADFVDPDGEDGLADSRSAFTGSSRTSSASSRPIDDYDDILLKALADRSRRASPRCFMRSPQPAVGLCRRAFLERRPDPREVRRDPSGAWVSRLPGPQPEAGVVRDARRQSGRSHADREFRDASDLGRVGFYFGHRDSQYFGVARIGRDQLEDYSARRGVSVEQAERWLRPNLD